MIKYYYENLLSNQNLTAKTNVVWAADITVLNLFRDKKAYVFLCIDIFVLIFSRIKFLFQCLKKNLLLIITPNTVHLGYTLKGFIC